MSTDARVGVVGATGAIGQELLAVLHEAPWRPDEVTALARASTSVPSVAWGDDTLPVDDVAHADLGALDLLFVAVPRDEAGPLVDEAVQAGVAVVDLSGSQLDSMESPIAVPWLPGGALSGPRGRDVVTIPSAPGLLLASLLGPLAAAGIQGSVDATILLPASAFGRDAVQELSGQVVGLMNASPPPRKIFPQGLAFDLLPLVGEVGATGWTGDEVRVVAEVARLLGRRVHPTLVATPLFSGMGATVRLGGTDATAVAHALREAGISLQETADPRRLPRPRRVEGEPFIHVGRVRDDLEHEAVHLWVGMDNLRTPAVAAVGMGKALLDQLTGA